MGAGILECDVTFTKDLAAGLPARAERPAHDHQHPRHAAGQQVHAAVHAGRPRDRMATLSRRQARSAAPSDITLAEFKTLRGKMDALQPARQTPAEFLGGTADSAPISMRARPAAPADAQGEHRAVQAARREDDARAEERRAWRCRSTASRSRRTRRR